MSIRKKSIYRKVDPCRVTPKELGQLRKSGAAGEDISHVFFSDVGKYWSDGALWRVLGPVWLNLITGSGENPNGTNCTVVDFYKSIGGAAGPSVPKLKSIKLASEVACKHARIGVKDAEILKVMEDIKSAFINASDGYGIIRSDDVVLPEHKLPTVVPRRKPTPSEIIPTKLTSLEVDAAIQTVIRAKEDGTLTIANVATLFSLLCDFPGLISVDEQDITELCFKEDHCP